MVGCIRLQCLHKHHTVHMDAPCQEHRFSPSLSCAVQHECTTGLHMYTRASLPGARSIRRAHACAHNYHITRLDCIKCYIRRLSARHESTSRRIPETIRFRAPASPIGHSYSEIFDSETSYSSRMLTTTYYSNYINYIRHLGVVQYCQWGYLINSSPQQVREPTAHRVPPAARSIRDSSHHPLTHAPQQVPELGPGAK